MKKIRLTFSIIAIATMALVAPAGSAQQRNWSYDLAIYGWLPTIGGNLSYDVPGVGDSVEIDPETLLDNLQFTAMSTVAARQGRWSVLADVIYLKEAKANDRTLEIGNGVRLKADLGVKAWVAGLGGSYQFAGHDRSRHAVLLGARYFSADTRFTVRGDGVGQTDLQLDSSAAVWNGVVGLEGRVALSNEWYVPYYVDFGTGDSDLTWQVMSGIGYDFDWGSVVLGYRALEFDQGEGESVINLTMNGAELALVFRF